MPHWLGPLLAIAVVIFVVAPLMGWIFGRYGKRLRGNAAMASILLGFGAPIDPPARHLIEAKEGRIKGGDESGDPPDPEM